MLNMLSSKEIINQNSVAAAAAADDDFIKEFPNSLLLPGQMPMHEKHV